MQLRLLVDPPPGSLIYGRTHAAAGRVSVSFVEP